MSVASDRALQHVLHTFELSVRFITALVPTPVGEVKQRKKQRDCTQDWQTRIVSLPVILRANGCGQPPPRYFLYILHAPRPPLA